MTNSIGGDSLMVEQLTNQLGNGGSNPTSPLQFSVIGIPKEMTYEWILNKHYAKRIPPITMAFGLFGADKEIIGILTFGSPAKLFNDGAACFDGKLSIRTLELNRLVINESVPKNTLSYFVSHTLKQLPKPLCLVSYSDMGQNHHGYIYQATNWLYTGETMQTGGYTYYFDGDWQHPRTTVSKFGTREHATILRKFPSIEFMKVPRKYRYFYFIGNKKEKEQMRNLLKYPILPYPKGDNKRYDASYSPQVQGLLL